MRRDLAYAAPRMTEPPDSVAWYDAHAAALAQAYEVIESEALHGWFGDLLPAAPGLVLDVGAGTGRDSAGSGTTWLPVSPRRGCAPKRSVGTRARVCAGSRTGFLPSQQSIGSASPTT